MFFINTVFLEIRTGKVQLTDATGAEISYGENSDRGGRESAGIATATAAGAGRARGKRSGGQQAQSSGNGTLV